MQVVGQVSDKSGRALRNIFEVDPQDLLGELPVGALDPADSVLTLDSDTNTFVQVPVTEFLSGSGAVTGGANVGAGDGQVFSALSANTLQFRTIADGLGINVTTSGDVITLDAVPGTIGALISHSLLLDLSNDDHGQYALLAGRSGGQTMIGGTGAGDDLTLRATAHATPGSIVLHLGSVPSGGVGGTDEFLLVNTSGAIQSAAPASVGAAIFPLMLLEDIGNVPDSVAVNSILYYDGADWIAASTGGVADLFLGSDGAGTPVWNAYNVIPHSDLSALTWSTAGHTIDTNFVPDSDGTRSLGTAALRWTNLFLSGSILDASSNQVYVRRSGADTMTGFWNIGSNKLGVNTATTTANLNIAVSGTGTPGIFFSIGGSANERLISTVSGGGFGWNIVNENSATGNLQFRANSGDTLRLEFARDSNRIKIGSTAWGSWTAEGGEALGVEGLITATGGAVFNKNGGSTDPNNRFKVFKSDGTEAALYINPDTGTAGGVGFFTTTITGVLNFAAGRISTSKPGVAITLASVTDNFTEWYSDVAFSSSAYGFGWISESSATGDRVFFAKNGSATNSTVFYCKRSDQFVGVGSLFSIGGTAPSYQLHVGGTLGVEGAATFEAAVTLNDDLDHNGSAIGFYGVAPAAQPSAYTQTYATATKTHANLTSATLTDSTGGTANTTCVAIAGTGDDANLNNNFADIIAQVNALRVDLENAKQVLNAVIDDDQSIGIKA